MELKKIRNIHLYLGCFFAPLIILFIFSGIIQTLELHETKTGEFNPQKGESEVLYQPSALIKVIATMHMNHAYKGFKFKTNEFYKYFVIVMAFGLLATILLGVWMAFKFTPAKFVWLVILSGALAPVLLLLMNLFR